MTSWHIVSSSPSLSADRLDVLRATSAAVGCPNDGRLSWFKRTYRSCFGNWRKSICFASTGFAKEKVSAWI